MVENKRLGDTKGYHYKAVLTSPKVQVKFKDKKTNKYEVDKLYNVMEGL